MSRRVITLIISAVVLAVTLGIGVAASLGGQQRPAPPTQPPFRVVNGRLDPASLPAVMNFVDSNGRVLRSVPRDQFIREQFPGAPLQTP